MLQHIVALGLPAEDVETVYVADLHAHAVRPTRLLCLDSGENFEIVVVDDGSPDGTQDVVRRLQKEYGEHLIVRRPSDMPRTSVTRHVRTRCTVSSTYAPTSSRNQLAS